MRRVIGHLHSLAAWCGALPGGPALLLAMFVAGLGGSVAHCAPMCGPFVLGLSAERLARAPAAGLCEMTRLRGALLLPYHAGRLTTYAALGAVAASLGLAATQAIYVAPALLAVAGALCAGYALRRLAPRLWPVARGPVRRRPSLVARLATRVDRTQVGGGLLFGALLGLLPCGMLYAALALAAATASPAMGAAAMLAFGAGTAPTLFGVALAGHAARRLGAGRIPAQVAPAMLLANAAMLWLLAGRMLAG